MAIIPSPPLPLPPPPPSSFTNRSANPYLVTPQDQRSTEAFLLALLTAGGGLTGYIRTGSIPSVVAGTGVGALVCCLSTPVLYLPYYSSPPRQARGVFPESSFLQLLDSNTM